MEKRITIRLKEDEYNLIKDKENVAGYIRDLIINPSNDYNIPALAKEYGFDTPEQFLKKIIKVYLEYKRAIVIPDRIEGKTSLANYLNIDNLSLEWNDFMNKIHKVYFK